MNKNYYFLVLSLVNPLLDNPQLKKVVLKIRKERLPSDFDTYYVDYKEEVMLFLPEYRDFKIVNIKFVSNFIHVD